MPYFENGEDFIVGRLKIFTQDGGFYIQDPNIQLDIMLKHWVPNAFPYNPVQYFYRRDVQKSCVF